MTLRTIVVDDHAVVAQGIRSILEQVEGVELIGVFPSGEEALEKIRSGGVDIVLMDVNLGKGMNGLEACRKVKDESPSTKVLMLTMFTDPATVTQAVKAGADGYLTKGSSQEAVTRAIHSVVAGQSFLDPAVTEGVFDKLGDKDPGALSEREQDVLQKISEGCSTSEVGEALFLSEETVKTHLKQVFKKLGVRDRTEAVAEAFRRGLVH